MTRTELSKILTTLREERIKKTVTEVKEYPESYYIIKMDIWQGNLIKHIQNLENIILDMSDKMDDSGKEFLINRVKEAREKLQASLA